MQTLFHRIFASKKGPAADAGSSCAKKKRKKDFGGRPSGSSFGKTEPHREQSRDRRGNRTQGSAEKTLESIRRGPWIWSI